MICSPSVFPNGLHYGILPKRDFVRNMQFGSCKYRVPGLLNLRVPGRGVVEVPAGIAHFLEHKLFEEEDGHAFVVLRGWGLPVKRVYKLYPNGLLSSGRLFPGSPYSADSHSDLNLILQNRGNG